jgi:hypothetical protein
MTAMAMRATGVLLAVLLGVAIPNAASAQDGKPRQGGDSLTLLGRLPAQLLDLAQLPSLRQDDAPRTLEGALVGYRGPDGVVTIYLFRETPIDLPRGPDGDAVQAHLRDATTTMLTVLTRPQEGQKPPDLTRLPDYRHVSPGSPGFRCVQTRRAAAAAGDLERTDHLCVTSIRGRFLKFRGSFEHAATRREAFRRQFVALAEQAAAILEAP